MDDEGQRPPGAPAPDDTPGQETASLPSLPAEVSTGDDELRRLIDAGAATPEELRELAAKIREHRDREDELWRHEVRPALRKAKKGSLRFGDLIDRPEQPQGSNVWAFGLGIAAVTVVLVLMATQSSVLWVLLPLVGVLVYAFSAGRRGDVVEEPPPDRGAAD